MKEFKVIAEVGAIHIGDMERAKMLIRLAKEAGADYAKFQKRNPYESVPKSQWDKPHPNECFSYGKTYLEHRLNLEFTLAQHEELKKYCEEIGIGYSTSVWDMTSAKEIISINPDYIKIPSACNNNIYLIDYIMNNYSGDIHLSLGMTTRSERKALIEKYYLEQNRPGHHRFIWYHCVSGYPVPFEKMHLKEIASLEREVMFPENVGFSNHGYGVVLEPAAYILGARWFERHIVEDRAFRHTDASAAVEKQGLQKIVRDLHAIEKAMTYKPDELEEIESVQRNKLRCD